MVAPLLAILGMLGMGAASGFARRRGEQNQQQAEIMLKAGMANPELLDLPEFQKGMKGRFGPEISQMLSLIGQKYRESPEYQAKQMLFQPAEQTNQVPTTEPATDTRTVTTPGAPLTGADKVSRLKAAEPALLAMAGFPAAAQARIAETEIASRKEIFEKQEAGQTARHAEDISVRREGLASQEKLTGMEIGSRERISAASNAAQLKAASISAGGAITAAKINRESAERIAHLNDATEMQKHGMTMAAGLFPTATVKEQKEISSYLAGRKTDISEELLTKTGVGKQDIEGVKFKFQEARQLQSEAQMMINPLLKRREEGDDLLPPETEIAKITQYNDMIVRAGGLMGKNPAQLVNEKLVLLSNGNIVDYRTASGLMSQDKDLKIVGPTIPSSEAKLSLLSEITSKPQAEAPAQPVKEKLTPEARREKLITNEGLKLGVSEDQIEAYKQLRLEGMAAYDAVRKLKGQ